MSSQNCVILLLSEPILNKEMLQPFDSFDSNYTSLFYTTFLLNHIEIINSLKQNIQIFVLLDSSDKEETVNAGFNADAKIIFTENSQSIEAFIENISVDFQNILLIKENIIGITKIEFEKIFNLLNFDDNALVIGKSQTNNVIFLGLNKICVELINSWRTENINQIEFMKKIDSEIYHIFELNNFHQVKDKNDFKTLYSLLSSKENFSFCSQEIHEKFTNCFIEYKELLK
ncbi:MAG: hypothetical protein C0425_04745 [Chlorobiaceae bacterium]|nr:hypothetical protein [Chlorobiaceae bacterium]MBA4309625.1 hypothetical protein [Chlorobiaceae bacterium]